MSGFAGAALGAVSVLGPLLTGGYPVQLGPFTFQNFEVPEIIEMGGKQALTIHKLPGGGRVMDAMGRDDNSYSWSGHFLATLVAPDVDTRVQTLDQLRIAGQPLPLTIGSMNFDVVIESFVYKPRKAGLYDYSISVAVLSIPNTPPHQSLLGSLTSQLGSALGVNIPAAISTVSTVLSTVAPLLTAATGILLAPKSQAATPVLAGVANAATTVKSLRTTNTAALANATTALGSLVGTPGTAYTATTTLKMLGNAANNLTALSQVGSVLSNMKSTLNGSKTS